MTDTPTSEVIPDILPPESNQSLTSPPPVPPKKPGLLRRIFTSRKKQQAVAMQNGYLEMVDLIRAIRSHLDRQETMQSRVMTMLEKVPDTMERQQEVMYLFKQHVESGMENNRRLTDSMGNLNNTLASMDEAHRASSRTVTDLIHRSRESEQLLREVMRRSERRMTALLIVFTLFVLGLGFYFARGGMRPRAPRPESAEPAVIKVESTKPAPKPEPAKKPAEPAVAKKQTEPAAVEKSKPAKKEKPAPAPAPKATEPAKPEAEPAKEAPAVAKESAPATEPAAEPAPAQIVIELKTPEAVVVTAPVELQPAPAEPAVADAMDKPADAAPPAKKEKARKKSKSKPKPEAAPIAPEEDIIPPPAADAAP